MKIRISAMVLAVLIIASSFITVFAAASNTDTSTETETKLSTANKLEDTSDSSAKDVKVKLNKKKVAINEGETFKLKAKVNTKNSKVNFKSSDNKVAKVSKKGVITANNAGKARIKVTCDGVVSTCKVSVNSAGNNISNSTMQEIANKIGWQRQGKYYSSSIMCSAYSFAYAYKQVTGKTITPGSVWYAGGCTWAGGTQQYYSSSSAMLKAIKSEIDDNRACVGLLSARGSTHYVTFYSYKGNGTSLSDFTVVDPWDGKIKNASEFGYWNYQVITING